MSVLRNNDRQILKTVIAQTKCTLS